MLHNMQITNLMTSISLKLMSSPTGGANHQLWTMYDLLQAWKLNVEWDQPRIQPRRPQEIASIILKELCTLPDRVLAKEIEHIVKHYTSDDKNKITDCGKVIADWQG